MLDEEQEKSNTTRKEKGKSLMKYDEVTTGDHSGSYFSPEVWHHLLVVDGTDERLCLDKGWKFHFGELSNAEARYYDDSSWDEIDLPHDFSITQDYSQNGEAESGYKLGGTGWYRKAFWVSEATLEGCVSLQFDGAYAETEVFVNGIYLGHHPYGYTPFSFDLTNYLIANEENSLAVKVVNPIPSSRWYSGSGIYRSVHLKVAPKVYLQEYGVRIRTPDLEKQLRAGEPVKIQVEIALHNACDTEETVQIRSQLFEKSFDGQLSNVANPCVSEEIKLASGQSLLLTEQLQVSHPKLWQLTSPQLYVVRVEILKNGICLQRHDEVTGFRYLGFDKDKGFLLNGQAMKWQGVCLHHDQGALGAVAYRDAIERQVKLLKDMGVNAIRVTHNPSARVLKDMANELGMLLIEEAFDTWEYAKNGNSHDYAKWFHQTIGSCTANHLIGVTSAEQEWHDFHLKQMVKSDLNDPAMIMWSVGNELMEGHAGSGENYAQLLSEMIYWIDAIDGSRPVTFGDNKLKLQFPVSIDMAQALHNSSRFQGVIGYNYASGQQYDDSHAMHPDWIIYGSEVASAINSRGIYDVKKGEQRQDKQLSSYDQNTVSWGHLASEAWYDVITRDFVMGEFVWCGFDYLGEPTPWNGIGPGPVTSWPSPKSSYFGILDTAGFPKDTYYFYRSQWHQTDTTLHLLPSWEESLVARDEQNRVEVVVYSNANKVQLVHTGPDGKETDYGTKAFTEKWTTGGHRYQIYTGDDRQSQDHQNLYLTWHIPYSYGSLKAIAYDKEGHEIAETVGRSVVSTVGKAERLRLTPFQPLDKVTDKSLYYLAIAVEDAKGNLVSSATNRVTVQVEGPARLVAMDNGNAVDHHPYHCADRQMFSGKALAIIKMTGQSGEVKITASSDGLKNEQLSFEVTSQQVSSLSQLDSYNLSKMIYIEKNSPLRLPKTIHLRYSDFTIVEKTLTFDKSLIKELLESKGECIAFGRAEGVEQVFPVHISMISKGVAARNISLAVELGEEVVLPEIVAVYNACGELLPLHFPVCWQLPETPRWHQEGTVVVSGIADVMGNQLPVTASVRIARKTLYLDQNVAPTVVRLTEETSDNCNRENLRGIIQENFNPSSQWQKQAWSNREATQAGKLQTSFRFSYDTAQYLSRIVIYYYQDQAFSCLPQHVTFSWRKNELEEAVPIMGDVFSVEEVNDLTKITYDLEQPVSAVELIIHLENTPQTALGQPFVTIANIELYTVIGHFERHSSANLTELRFGKRLLSEEDIASHLVASGAEVDTLVVKSEPHHAAITVLPIHQDRIMILTDSEDGSQHNRYVIEVQS